MARKKLLLKWFAFRYCPEKHKIKRKFTFFGKYQNTLCYALVKMLIFSTHSMKYIWYSPKKSKYPLYIIQWRSQARVKTTKGPLSLRNAI